MLSLIGESNLYARQNIEQFVKHTAEHAHPVKVRFGTFAGRIWIFHQPITGVCILRWLETITVAVSSLRKLNVIPQIVMPFSTVKMLDAKVFW